MTYVQLMKVMQGHSSRMDTAMQLYQQCFGTSSTENKDDTQRNDSRDIGCCLSLIINSFGQRFLLKNEFDHMKQIGHFQN